MNKNKNIKITRNALTGKELLILYEKHSEKIEGINLKKTSSLKKRFYSTKTTFDLNKNLNKKNEIYLSYITPLKPKKYKSISKVINIQDKKKKPFTVMDIETIGLEGKEIPISISIKTANNLKIFLIDHNLLVTDVELAIKELWSNFFDFILINCNKEVIFVHNLGSFDGFFIYKALSNKFKPEEVSCLIDTQNKFIQITLEREKLKIGFKDSYRIFQVSLQDLCSIFRFTG